MPRYSYAYGGGSTNVEHGQIEAGSLEDAKKKLSLNPPGNDVRDVMEVSAPSGLRRRGDSDDIGSDNIDLDVDDIDVGSDLDSQL